MKSTVFDPDRQKVPLQIWSDLKDVEISAMDQLKNMASLPFVFKHVAAMPDVHLGRGATVGSVIATQGAVVPAAVGVDIGCGMMAVEIDERPELILAKAKEIRHSIERAIPLGHESNRHLTPSVEAWEGWARWQNLFAAQLHSKGESKLKSTAMAQLGSLGSGNHFIELCTDQSGRVWAMLHSGSRNIGKSLAEMHINEAKDEMRLLSIQLPDPDLAYYLEGTRQYEQYMSDLAWAQEYAFANRIEMMKRVMKCVSHAIGFKGAPLKTGLSVNCHHNYATKENHYGENVLVTRKGAVRAGRGDYGIIPGSMGTKSYIVEGLGNPESFMSCSHGAGRRMSRSEAKRKYTLKDLEIQTQGVESRKDKSVLDEIPAAYKDIDVVMENQKDLVRVVAQLKQFMCIKGG